MSNERKLSDAANYLDKALALLLASHDRNTFFIKNSIEHIRVGRDAVYDRINEAGA